METHELQDCRICKAKPRVTSDSNRMEACCEYYCEIGCPHHAGERVFAVSLDSAIDAQHEAEEKWNKRMMEGIDPATGKRDWKETCRLCRDGVIEDAWFCEYYGEPDGCNAPSGEHGPVTEKVLTVNDPEDALRVLRAELERRTVYLWQTKDGSELPVREMTDEHLERTIAMLARVEEERDIILENAIDAGGWP